MATTEIPSAPDATFLSAAPSLGAARALAVLALGLGGSVAVLAPALLRIAERPEPTGVAVLAATSSTALLATVALLSFGAGSLTAGLRRASHSARSSHVLLIGTGIGLPLVRFHARILSDTDSVRLVSSVQHIRLYGWSGLRETQEPVVPHLLLRAAIQLGGLSGARLVAVVGAIALISTVTWLAWRLGTSVGGAVVAGLMVLSTTTALNFAAVLPMYPLMLILGYLGAYLAYRSVASRRAALVALAAAVLLALAPEAHTLGQIFLVAPALLVVAQPGRRMLLAQARVYGFLALALVPRFLVNYSIDGFRYIRSGRVEWFVQRGYLDLVNEKTSGASSTLEYLGEMRRLVPDLLGPAAWIVVPAVLAAVATAAPPARRLALGAFGVVIASIVIQQPGLFGRYLSPLLPGAAILVGGLADRLRGGGIRRVAVVALVLALLAAGSYGYHDRVRAYRNGDGKRAVGALAQIAGRIPPGDRVFGIRATKLYGLDPDLDVWGPQYLTEKEVATFLMWRKPEAVMQVLRRNGIKWVVVTDHPKLEEEYHDTWLVPTYGFPARHLAGLRDSPDLCEVYRSWPRTLYRVGACDDGSSSGADGAGDSAR